MVQLATRLWFRTPRRLAPVRAPVTSTKLRWEVPDLGLALEVEAYPSSLEFVLPVEASRCRWQTAGGCASVQRSVAAASSHPAHWPDSEPGAGFGSGSGSGSIDSGSSADGATSSSWATSRETALPRVPCQAPLLSRHAGTLAEDGITG